MKETAEFMDPEILDKIASKLNPYWQRKFALEDKDNEDDNTVIEV